MIHVSTCVSRLNSNNKNNNKTNKKKYTKNEKYMCRSIIYTYTYIFYCLNYKKYQINNLDMST